MSPASGDHSPVSPSPGDRGRKPRPHAGRAPEGAARPALQPEIIAVLRATAEQTMARHQPTADGRCCYCSQTWLHTDTMHPCPPYRIAAEFRSLTD